VVYIATVAGIAGMVIVPERAVARAIALRTVPVAAAVRPASSRPAISGRPVRIVIPASGVDLPVDPGYYNVATGEWTLSGYHAQFAMMSSLANDQGGDTFIYGHNNNYVFGALRHHTPLPDATALVYTDNGHVFTYSFISSSSFVPTDTSVFTYSGPPMLTIQTCTGGLNEWRTMYKFRFIGVQSS
jgi:hypothetical protein